MILTAIQCKVTHAIIISISLLVGYDLIQGRCENQTWEFLIHKSVF